MANIFKEAKKIQRMHKSWDWQKCIQEASRRHKPKKSVGAVKKKSSSRQTGSSNKKRDRVYAAKKPGKRKSHEGAVYYERRKNRSDAPGQLTGLSVAHLKSTLKKKLTETLGDQMARQFLATSKRLKKKIAKSVLATKITLRKLSS